MNRYKVMLYNWITSHLFNGITENDVLRFKDGKYRIEGHEVDRKLLATVASEAKSIKDKYAWEILIKDVKYEANKAIYHKSQTTDDLVFGKAMLATIEIIENKLNDLSKIND